MQEDLHLGEAQRGLLFSAFFWTYACVQIPVGWLAERFGAHRVLAAGLAVWAIATILIGVAHTFPTLLALRLLLGIVAFAYLFGPAVGTLLGGLLMARFGCCGCGCGCGRGRAWCCRRAPYSAAMPIRPRRG